MKKKIVCLLAVLLSVSLVVVGCGGSKSGATADYAMETTDSYDGGGFDASLGSYYADTEDYEGSADMEAPMADNAAVGSAKKSSIFDSKEASNEEATEEAVVEPDENTQAKESDEPEYDTSRKIVYTSYINIETKKFDDDVKALKKLVRSYNGYYENSSVTGTAEYGGRTASYTARVPAKQYQEFMDSLGDIGSVTSSNEYVDDITSSYVDAETRLKTLNTKLDRLLELEKNAQTVEELLKIEDRINNVTYDIESYKAQLRLYDDKIDYCTVTIDLDEVVTYTEVKKDTAWNRFVEAFKNSIAGFLAVVQALIIGLIYVLPYLAVAGVILVIVLIITKKRRTIRKKKLEEKLANEREEINNQQPAEDNPYVGPVYTDDTEENQ
ncbi:protein of unknown function [Pseudobutyrivibrio sp. YE44]|uniref:DUF4349 domain-containing protein n=1 Tax=Pseudobutyrivibrio sp. YE44 TaxID=1520802 RepID=UPI000885B3F3|nr:DUF4349 domain-containing protein [Pseudobutyrivibrio sp. YE44]SDB04379.1 protein of unknown function [Pseudobutyrivibrio sp. YE44]